MEAGGRWNGVGRRVVYASTHLSLAILEILATADLDTIPYDYLGVELHVPDDVPVEQVDIAALPADWQTPNHPACVALGDAWLDRGSSAILDVPSAVLPLERNIVLNPNHADFARLELFQSETSLQCDPRIVGLIRAATI